MAVTCTPEWPASRRSNSTPVYPVPPATPTLIKPGSGPRHAAKSHNDKAAVRRLCAYRFLPASASAFRELLAASRLVQADFLALDLARVARHEPGLRKRRLERRVVLDQGARDAMADRAGLPRFATAEHVHLDVERLQVIGELEGLAHDHAAGLPREEDVDGLVVHRDVALAGLDEHARHRVLATARTVVVFADHSGLLRSRGSWAAARRADSPVPRRS